MNPDSSMGRASFLTTGTSGLEESSATWIAVTPSFSSLGPVFAFCPIFFLYGGKCAKAEREKQGAFLYVFLPYLNQKKTFIRSFY